MKENQELTPAKSLEIIGSMMAQSRKDIHQALGVHLMGWGLLVAVTGLAVGYLWHATQSAYANLLWIAMMVVGIIVSWCFKQKKAGLIPRSYVSETIGKVWLCFGIFCCLLGCGAGVMSEFIYYAIATLGIENTYTMVPVTPVILLLFGLVCSSTGFILRDYLIVVCGVIAGFGGFVGSLVFQHASMFYAVSAVAFVSLFIPGLRIYIKTKRLCYHR